MKNVLAILSCIGAIFAFSSPVATYGQLPDAPLPMEYSSSNAADASAPFVISPTPAYKPTPAKKHRWITPYHESIATLVIGETVDMWGTKRNMTHPKFVCGYDPILGADNAISTTDKQTYSISMLCNSFQSQKANYAYDVTQGPLGMFTEGGWAAKWGLTGKRNFAGVAAWNIANDAGQAFLAGYLERKRGWRGKIGTAMNFSHGIVHLTYGIENFQLVAQNSNPNDVFKKFPNALPAWADSFPRWWGKK